MMLNNIDEKELANSQLNITVKNEPPEEGGITIPIAEIWHSLKRFAALWIVAAVFSALVVSAEIAVFSQQLSSAPVALIGFDYDGAEYGRAPGGGEFDVNSIKTPVVIENALTKLGYPLQYVESVRNAISIQGIMPTDAVDEMSVYKAAYEENGSLQAAQAMLSVNFNYTQYLVTFNFEETPFGDDEAAQVINTVLECYRDYFFEKYGYSETIGNAGLAVDYSDYDYLIAVDNYNSMLGVLGEVVDKYKYEGFRSTETGFSFSDLSDSINTVHAYEADALAAYIISNSIVRDKESMLSYYEYRISELERSKKSAQENLDAIKASIEAYEKDTVVMFDGTAEDALSYTTASEKYDNLFTQKSLAQLEVSRYNQRISESKARLEAVKKLGSKSSDPEKTAYVEERLAVLSEEVDTLVENVNKTVLEYNESVEFANAYSVLVPASVLSTSYISMLMKNIIKPIIFAEAGVFFFYVALSTVHGCVTAYRKKDKQSETQE